MFTKQIPLLSEAMKQDGWSQSIVDAFAQTFGNCQQPIEHSAPVVISADFPDAPVISWPGASDNEFMPPFVGDPDDPIGGERVEPDFENPNAPLTAVGDPAGHIDVTTGTVVGTPAGVFYGPVIINGPTIMAGPLVINRVVLTINQWQILVNFLQQIQTNGYYPVTDPNDWSFDTDTCEIVISSDLELEAGLETG